MPLDWEQVSSRIKDVLNLGDADDLRRAAARLDVRALQVEEAIDRRSRLATLKVAAAIVREHGIDPSWLLTGTYDAATHRVGLQKNRDEIDRLLKKLAVGVDSARDKPSELRIS
jgi:hypothetical protein